MPIAKKILLVLIVTVIFVQSLSTKLEAITITSGSHEFESFRLTPYGVLEGDDKVGLFNCSDVAVADPYELTLPADHLSINDLVNEPETWSMGSEWTRCDFNPKDCGAAKLNNNQRTSAATTVHSTDGSSENPGTTSFLLLVLGLLGLSRLRGRPIIRGRPIK